MGKLEKSDGKTTERKRVMFVGGGYDEGYESDTYNPSISKGAGVYMLMPITVSYFGGLVLKQLQLKVLKPTLNPII